MANWIKGAIKRKGSLRRELGVAKGSTISPGALASASHQSGRMGRQARLAITLRSFNKRRRRK